MNDWHCPAIIPHGHALAQQPSPPRVVWAQITYSEENVRTLDGHPTVDELVTAQLARGRKILAVMVGAAERTRIVVAEEFLSFDAAYEFFRTMMREIGGSHETAEKNYGAVETVICLGANECFDISAFLDSLKT